MAASGKSMASPYSSSSSSASSSGTSSSSVTSTSSTSTQFVDRKESNKIDINYDGTAEGNDVENNRSDNGSKDGNSNDDNENSLSTGEAADGGDACYNPQYREELFQNKTNDEDNKSTRSSSSCSNTSGPTSVRLIDGKTWHSGDPFRGEDTLVLNDEVVDVPGSLPPQEQPVNHQNSSHQHLMVTNDDDCEKKIISHGSSAKPVSPKPAAPKGK